MAASMLSVLSAAFVFHPRFGDAATMPSPTPLAAFIWTHAPSLDNPLPEVFAERIAHLDGPVSLPVATSACDKALVVGTGADVIWPANCVRVSAPAECVEAGALCYANRGSWAMAPNQPAMTR